VFQSNFFGGTGMETFSFVLRWGIANLPQSDIGTEIENKQSKREGESENKRESDRACEHEGESENQNQTENKNQTESESRGENENQSVSESDQSLTTLPAAARTESGSVNTLTTAENRHESSSTLGSSLCAFEHSLSELASPVGLSSSSSFSSSSSSSSLSLSLSSSFPVTFLKSSFSISLSLTSSLS
jgi:hypothetical protein